MTARIPLVAALIAFSLLIAACTSDDDTTTSTTTTTGVPETAATTSTTVATAEPLDPEGFYLNLMWHQHQPLYPKTEEGVVTRPWVRAHATKDYYDMAALVAEYPDVHVTFNLTPVLLLQLEELANGTKDIYWVLSEVPADALDADQKQFIQERFFDTNPRIIARFPRYQELADRRDSADFSEQDYRDLQVLFNLAWTDPSFLAQEPLAALVAKERDYSEADKAVIFAEHLRIIEAVPEIHRELWDAGQIEVTTTPLAHPILPLVADTSLAAVGDPTGIPPTQPFREVNDAVVQVQRGLEEAERILGRRPVGMWPGEGAVAQLVMGIFAKEGVDWVATGEDVLAETLGIGSFTRNSDDTVEQADLLYRPYAAQLSRNEPVDMFFRDVVLSDLVGFEYSGTPAAEAADDFMTRLATIKDTMEASGVAGPGVVSVILDGENAWENYENDGIDFLRALYGELSAADWVRTVTPSELLAAFPDSSQPLPDVFPAAWFSPNYATWIGEQEEAVAWDYLNQARSDLRKAEQSGTVDPDDLAAAFELMLFAEGSDWFWWYGSDQDSGDDGYFDAAYRELLGQMYDALGQERPAYVSIPIIPLPVIEPDRTQGDLATITIDNEIRDEEWAAAGRYDLDGELLSGVEFTFDKQNLYLRVDFAREVLGDDSAAFELYLGSPGVTSGYGLTDAGTVLGFDATHLAQWSGMDPVQVLVAPYDASANLPDDRLAEAGVPTGFDGQRVEFAIALDELGALDAGDRIRFRIADTSGGPEQALLPEAPGYIQVPDVSDVETVVAASDPTGDDYGPGSFTYPTDAVFAAGSYDLTDFSVGISGDDLVFTLDVLAPIQNSWDSPSGFSIQTFDVYIDQDPGAGTGARLLIPGRNAALNGDDGAGWEYALTLEGWYPALYVAQPDGTAEETEPTFKMIVNAEEGRLVARLPRELFGDGDPSTWGYAVAVMSQEGFPSSGVRRIRDVNPAGEQYRLGGGRGTVNETRIIDVLWPESGLQEDLLSNLPDVGGAALDDLSPDEFVEIPLLLPT
jgi:alpha-amylase/alpha-mannosidase (GH57 family)